jgi:hypothetical protein
MESVMSTTTTIPVTVTPEAAARIADLGFQPQVDRMVDYARTHLPDLDRIEIVRYERYELGNEPGLAIEAYSRRPFDIADQSDRRLDRWMIEEFPPEVLEHLLMSYRPGAPDAG